MTPRPLALLIAATIFILDQLTKYLVTVPLALADVGQVELLPILNLTWVENRGVSLGMLTADGHVGRWALVALTGAIALGVLAWIWRETNRLDAAALGLILGGAIGNIVDRSRYGYVVDFIDIHFGELRPVFGTVFNVADAAITIGVVMLLARSLFGSSRKEVQDA